MGTDCLSLSWSVGVDVERSGEDDYGLLWGV
jgi:hypothetical protein